MLTKRFIKPYGRSVRPIVSLLSVLLLLILYFTFTMWQEISGFDHDIERLTKATATFKEETLKLNSEHTPTKKQVAELESKLYRLSQIFIEAKSSVLVLFNKLEKIIPESVSIQQLNHNGTSAKTNIIALAENVDGISAFLEQLEADNDLSSVLLKRQSHIKIKGAQFIEFELSINEKRAK